jgi:osmoprotectant transport system ATP-binding protein
MSVDARTGGAPVRISDVTVRYPGSDRAAVDNVSLDVAAGEFVVFLGPSGCGKSTLLRTINRLIVPDAGTIAVGDTDVAQTPPQALRRGIGYVIQAGGLFPHYTIARNIAVVPELLGWEKARIDARVDELLELVRLDPARYRNRFPRELSGGEQQRVGVARALAAQPRVLLMDEPFGAVDAIVRASLQAEVRRIHAALGTTIFFVTHDVDEALGLADRLVVMNAGRIEQAASPLEVLAKPQTPYVSELLDSRDVVRRLQLMHVRDAMHATDATSAPAPAPETNAQSIAAEATLREALSDLLESDGRIAVAGDGHIVGSLGFEDVRAALARTAA